MSYYFRVDANDQIGIGHLMRCLSIARAMRKLGTEATFFVADKESAGRVAEAGFGYVCLNSDYDHLDVESDKLLQIMRERCAENLLVDSYYVTETYLQKIREVANLTYIDDINKFIYPCDLLINYNIYAERLDYPGRYKAEGLDTDFALGLTYMPLREEFIDLKKTEHEGIRILVTTGATDSMNVLGNFLRKAVERGIDKKAEITAIIGQYNHHRDELISEFGSNKSIHLLDPVESLAGLIAESDIAVTAGGTTVYELCAGGTAAVMLTIADNQMRAALEFSRKDIIPYAGDVRFDMDLTMECTADKVMEYIDSDELRLDTARKMKRVVDGHGAERLAGLLLSRVSEKNGSIGIG